MPAPPDPPLPARLRKVLDQVQAPALQLAQALPVGGGPSSDHDREMSSSSVSESDSVTQILNGYGTGTGVNQRLA